MTDQHAKPHRVWTVAEAKARLSEILRLAEEEGPQRIGARKPFIVVPALYGMQKREHGNLLARGLVDNIQHGIELDIPSRHETGREIPFVDGRSA